MSAEAFETVLTCDMRTALDGRGVDYAPAGEGRPRWFEADRINRDAERRWATCYVNAEQAVRIAAAAVRAQPMTGLTGDHPERRELVAGRLEALADLVRLLALDHACDAVLTDDAWHAAVGADW